MQKVRFGEKGAAGMISPGGFMMKKRDAISALKGYAQKRECLLRRTARFDGKRSEAGTSFVWQFHDGKRGLCVST